MREPTAAEVLYAWHTAALQQVTLYKGVNASRIPVTSEPQPGWYRGTLVPKGAWVPARIWMEQEVDEIGELLAPEVLRCEIDGGVREPDQEWLWLCKQPISFKEFDYMTRLRAWQRVNAPDEYDAARQPVDHLSTPILEE